MEEFRALLFHKIIEIYGIMQGQSISGIIIPAFLGDFKKVLEKSDSEDEISEEYMTEDKKIHLVLTGRRIPHKKSTELVITGCEFNDDNIFSRIDSSKRIVLC